MPTCKSKPHAPPARTPLTADGARPGESSRPLARRAGCHRRPYRASSARQVCATARSWRPTPWHACAVTFHRREVLASLGAASASTLLWALGCGGPAPLVRRAPQVSGEVRTWLRDAVAQLAAVHPFAHAL